ncbi:MAG: peptidoglycan glycosyltransferase [Acidaminococcales bacterium]|jgi:cell division protein FtsI/penicillin-binding protein 2|nr:peptidoglycan glycosyltransferase [Acidaminococcales bacterium]
MANRQKYKTAAPRALFVLTIVGAGFLACILRIGWLQLVRGEALAARAAANKNILRELQSPRGAIYDREGRELAISLISLSLYAHPSAMDDGREQSGQRDPRRLAAQLISRELGKSEQELYDIFTGKEDFVWLERTMDKDRTDRLGKILSDNRLNGFGFIKESKRYYPMGPLAAQVLGFVGTDDVGLSGIEAELDSLLKSAVLPQFIETDTAGRPIFSSVLVNDRPQDMASVYLTIDNRIQYAAEKAIAAAVSKTGAKAASALVLDVDTGEILAMAGNPTFDPNYFYNYDEKTWRNFNISIVYEPGSTFKPLVAAAAINEGIVEPQTLFFDTGKLTIDDREISNSGGRSFGSIPFSEVITLSLNTSMAEIAFSLGRERLNKYARAFGFGDYTHIDLPGEEAGILFRTDSMRKIDMASMSIGQGIAVTPLQLVCAISAIAGGGRPIRPSIVKSIMQPDGSERKKPERPPKAQVVSAETSKKVLDMMEGVVLKGGGALAQIPGYRIAGKTGTAEKMKSGGGYAKNEYIASFVGIAPVEKPRFVALVLIDTPHSSYYGSETAAPVFKEIMQQTLVVSGIEPSAESALPPIKRLEPASGDKSRQLPLPAVDGKYTCVPDVTGFTMRECAKILEQNALALLPRGSGRAARQEPPALSVVEDESVVTVWFE